MAFIVNSISSALTQELIASGGNYSSLNSLRITNTSPSSSTCQVDLFIVSKNTGRYYILKGKLLKALDSFVLDSNSLKFSNKRRQDVLGDDMSYSMNIKLTDPYGIVTPSVDIVIN